jgi:hypothetical protein
MCVLFKSRSHGEGQAGSKNQTAHDAVSKILSQQAEQRSHENWLVLP